MAHRPRIFLDADVIFAGSAAPSTQGTSYVVLLMGEITLLDCFTSIQVMTEVERNLADKLPHALAEFRLLAKRCLTIVPDPKTTELHAFVGQADPKDLPILVAAVQANCSYLIAFNTRHFMPTDDKIVIQRPGEFLRKIRSQLSFLSSAEEWGD
ncbi:MAG TPA: PIN domain-containing protein [Anaerolineae bacterium]|nr:PIN domain-containing protein [Anaerolineae bacterium]